MKDLRYETNYDTACKELAEHFLQDEKEDGTKVARVHSLAQAIQEAVEDWCEDEP